MPRRDRPAETQRSEHWLRVAVNDRTEALNTRVRYQFGWRDSEQIEWLSPVRADAYAEYYDDTFLECLGVGPTKVPLRDFWPASGPRWDGLARTASGKLILVEAKAYIEEAVDFQTSALGDSRERIMQSLDEAKLAFGARPEAPWPSPLYQYANRLAHLYFLRELNGLDAHLLFLYFADAPDVPEPASIEQWQGAARLVKKCLGLGEHPFRWQVGTVIWSVPKMLADQSGL